MLVFSIVENEIFCVGTSHLMEIFVLWLYLESERQSAAATRTLNFNRAERNFVQ